MKKQKNRRPAKAQKLPHNAGDENEFLRHWFEVAEHLELMFNGASTDEIVALGEPILVDATQAYISSTDPLDKKTKLLRLAFLVCAAERGNPLDKAQVILDSAPGPLCTYDPQGGAIWPC